MDLDAGQLAKDMVADKKKQYEEGPASPANAVTLGLLQTQLDAYFADPIGIKYMEKDDPEAVFTHSLVDYVRKLAIEKTIAESRQKTDADWANLKAAEVKRNPGEISNRQATVDDNNQQAQASNSAPVKVLDHNPLDFMASLIQDPAARQEFLAKHAGNPTIPQSLPFPVTSLPSAPLTEANVKHQDGTTGLKTQQGSKTRDVDSSSDTITNPWAEEVPLYTAIFPDLPPPGSTTPSPLLSVIINETIHIPNPAKPGEFIPATHNIKDPSQPSSSATTISKTYTVQLGDTVSFSPVDGSVTAVLRAEKYVYRCVPACKRDAELKQRLQNEVSGDMIRLFWDDMVKYMTRTWTKEGVDLAAMRVYIAPEMQGMQRWLWEREMDKMTAKREHEAVQAEAKAAEAEAAVESLEEVSGLREREFCETDDTPRAPVMLELAGGLGVWLRERRQGDHQG